MQSLRRYFVRSCYDFAFVLLLALLLPWLVSRLLRRGQWRSQFYERFGRFHPQFRERFARTRPLWLHAVSVGEVNLVIRLARELQQKLPDTPLVVSTTTTTGMAELTKRLPPGIERIYFPLDLSRWVRRSLQAIHPIAIVLVEAEIWPNFLWRATDLQVPVALVNARVSEKSRNRYRALRAVFSSLFRDLALVTCASESEARRLREVGCRPECIHTVGNLKYDLAEANPPSPEVAGVLRQLGFAPDIPILLGGSTHAGEEALLGRVLLRLRRRHPQLRLIVVPRHFERAADAVRDLQTLGLTTARRSQVDPDHSSRSLVPPDAVVVDSTGELRSFYGHATVVFIGKSLLAKGGQNPIEPAALGRAMVAGPHMDNFKWVIEDLKAHQALVQVTDEAGLEEAVNQLLSHSELRDSLGARARQVVQSNTGSLHQTVDLLIDHILSSPPAPAP